MNYMEQVAKMLGVELGEEFEIVFPHNLNCHATALINSEKLYITNHNVANQDLWQLNALTNLLNGNYTIKRKPWKPIYRNLYWSIQPNGDVMGYSWLGEWIDIYHYKIGNCYPTEEDALNNRDKWLAFYESDEVLEV